MPRRVALVALLICLPVPSTLAAHAAAVGADGPDPDGVYTLTYAIHRDAAGEAALSLDVARTDADGVLHTSRDLGALALPAGDSTRSFSFLPAEGAGQYSVALVVDGVATDALTFDVDDAGGSTTVTFEVADAATYVNLTNDTVNADGKTKSPGEALLTRGILSDGNGLADVDAFVWSIERAGSVVATGVLALPPEGTSWTFEHRFDRSPFEAGDHTLVLRALRDGATLAEASRTFAIREVAPTFVGGALANVTPDATSVQTVAVTLADRNGAPSGALEARVYRGSARVEGSGFAAALGVPMRLADEGGAGLSAYPLSLTVPERATPGAYRVSLYADGDLLGAVPFDVLPLPYLSGVNATTEDGRLVLRAAGSGEGVLVARLADDLGASSTLGGVFANGTGALTLDAPRRGVPLRWNVTLFAREGGPAIAWREGDWSLPSDTATLSVDAIYARARLPASWRVSSSWPLADANATFHFTRWDGQSEARLSGALSGDRARIDAPADLEAGRYTARLVLAWPNGSVSETSWAFDAGPWVELSLGAPVVDGASALLPVRNAGGLVVTRFVIEAEPAANLTLQHAGETLSPTMVAGRARFAATLAPGEEATLRVDLPGPHRSGRHEVALRVLARVDLA